MKLAKFLFIALLLISCSNDDSLSENNTKTSILIKEINANTYNSSVSNGLKTTFEYDSKQRLTKKTGGYIYMSASTGYSGFYTNEVYTSLTYQNNTVVIENFSTSPTFTVPKETKIVTLNSSNQIQTKEVPSLVSTYKLKKLIYTYSQNRIVKIITTFPNIPYNAADPNDYILTYEENFDYDSNGNLTKSEYFEQHNGVNKGEKIIRTFEDYDNSENPFKKLQLLDDFFYRSISKNNFRKVTVLQYMNDELSSRNTSTWTFSYDTKGQIII